MTGNNQSNLSPQILEELRALALPQKREVLMKFFKTGKGEYGEGDRFLGITVPLVRQTARRYFVASMATITPLLQSPWHEARLCGLMLLLNRYNKCPDERSELVEFYLSQAPRINNWDLVDLSAPGIVGHYLLTHPRQLLYRLAADPLLWNRRIAVVSTLTLIRHDEWTDTLRLVELLKGDTESLMHKAMGWMLREVGKRNETVLTDYLEQNATTLPRTTLRYAIERFAPEKRRYFLQLT